MNTIIIDMDCVTNDFVPFFCEIAYTKFKMNFEGDVYANYNLTSCMVGTNNQKQKVLADIFSMPYFWQNLPVMKDSYDTLMKLSNKGYQLDIASMTPPKADIKIKDMVKREKYKWLDRVYPTINFNHIYLDVPKHTLCGTYIIDDNPANIYGETYHFKGEYIKYNYKYNESARSDYSVSNWKQIDNLFKEIEGRK